MSYNKFDFINDLLSSKKIKIEEKNRILNLTKTELKSFDSENEKIKKRIDNIEDKIKKLEGKTKNDNPPDTTSIEQQQNELPKYQNQKELKKNEPSNTPLPKYINPFANNGMSRFLKAYNENPILNSTCHEIDDEDSLKRLLEHFNSSEYNFNIHLERIKKEFEKLTKEYNINTKIYSLIKGYIYGGVKWSTDIIEMSWSENALLLWTQNNSRCIPNPGINFIEKYEQEGYSLTNPFVSSLTGQNITTFSDFVILFKSMFHINSNNSLKKNITRINEIKNFINWADIDINENKFGENIHLYTDVDKLIQAYVKLIELIKSINIEFNINERPKIIISFFEQEKDILFSIHHINATYKKSLMSTLNHPFGQSMPPIIERQINGLCNLDVKADFGNNDFAKINLWDGSPIRVVEKFEEFKGVEYILKFER
jgi:hypothetical protein